MFRLLREKIGKFIGKTEEAAEKEATEVERNVEETLPAHEPAKQAQPQAKEPEKGVKLSAATHIKSIFKKTVKLSEGDLEGILADLQMDLIQSDVAMETSEAILGELKERLLEGEIEKDNVGGYVKYSLRKTLLDVLTPEKEVDLISSIKQAPKPYKIVFFGVNGTGKTTTIAKMAQILMDSGFSVVIAAGDTFRAGAIEQIEKHASNIGVKLVKHQKTGDAAAVIYDAVEHAKARNVDVVLADTAGRMQTNVNLMDEMKKIVRVNKPDMKIFIGDSLTGNDAVDQAEKFNQEIGIDAVILTKMDADAKGGSAISISHVTKRPVIYVGVGQAYKDLKKFDREWFVSQIID